MDFKRRVRLLEIFILIADSRVLHDKTLRLFSSDKKLTLGVMVFVESALSYWSLVNNGGFLEASWGLPSIYIEPIVVSPNFEITVECGLKFHWYLKSPT